MYFDPGYTDYLVGFKMMVKSGEVQTTEELVKDESGYILN